MLHLDFLIDSRLGGDELDSRSDTADLILPAASGTHDLLHAEHDIIQVIIGHFLSEKFKDRFYTGSGQNTAGSKT